MSLFFIPSRNNRIICSSQNDIAGRRKDSGQVVLDPERLPAPVFQQRRVRHRFPVLFRGGFRRIVRQPV